METITLDKAIKTALACAESSFERGLLFNSFPDEDFESPNGDPETIHTIVLLVTGSDVPVEGDPIANVEAIDQALYEKYPYLPSPPNELTEEEIKETIADSDQDELLNFILSNPAIASDEKTLDLLRTRNLELASEIYPL
tara:strand:+ start:452 stop:871 length:420 start_codon:yes stop_codon:yes gene_type:complete